MLTTSATMVLFLGPVTLAAMVGVVLFVVNRQEKADR